MYCIHEDQAIALVDSPRPVNDDEKEGDTRRASDTLFLGVCCT